MLCGRSKPLPYIFIFIAIRRGDLRSPVSNRNDFVIDEVRAKTQRLQAKSYQLWCDSLKR